MIGHTGRLRVSRIVVASTLLLAALTYACGGGGSDTPTQPPPVPPAPETPSPPPGTTQPPPPLPNLAAVRIISGAGQTDTILTVLPQPLVVEVHDSTGA